MEKHETEKILTEELKTFPNYSLLWIEKDLLIMSLKHSLAKVVLLNINQEDETFKTVVKFMDVDFCYVGEKIAFS